MVPKKLIAAGVIATAAGGGYYVHQGGELPDFSGQGTEQTTATDSPFDTAPPLSVSGTPQASLVGPPMASLGELVRFDADHSWVIANWSRVTTSVGDQQLSGLRVPIMTGTGLNDVSGSLTYFFDAQGRVQRISLYGYTGDASDVVQLVTGVYDMKPEPATGLGMYIARWNGSPRSLLRIQQAPLVQANRPHERFLIQCEINRPSNQYGLSPEFENLLAQDKAAGRWRGR